MSTVRDLVITRDIAVPRDKLYRCCTEPELIKQWFAPKPWTTPHAETDVFWARVRPAGAPSRGKRAPEHRQTALGLRFRHLVLQHIPVLPSATITPGSYFSVAGTLLIRLKRPSRPGSI
jgi:hypothetical protein